MSDKKIKMFIQDDILFITESPDVISVDHGNKTLFMWRNGGTAFAFGFMGNKCTISEEGGTHSDTEVGDRGKFDFPGRIWTDKKVISFWSYPPISKLKKLLNLLEKTFNDIPLSRYGSDGSGTKYNPEFYSGDYARKQRSRGEAYGKINFGSGWKIDIPAEGSDSYGDVVKKSGSKIISPKRFEDNGYLYSLKTVFSNKPLKGIGKKLRKNQSVNVDTGAEHMKSPMLKNKNIQKLDKKGKEDLWNYFKEKGRLTPAEKRMYHMIKKEGVDIYFDGEKFMFREAMISENEIRDELNTHDSHEVEIGKTVEKEHDNGDDVDVITSELNLMKVVLAHLREDPHYYSKLKKVEENKRKTFTLDEGSGILRKSD